jgi:cyclophilin family peptidyl-prolyl cis-trans isomerase
MAQGITPKTCQNFKALCTGECGKGGRFNRDLHYKGCHFFRVVPGQAIRAGDIEHDNGTGGESIFGGKFEDENYKLKHSKAGVVSMVAGSTRNSNGSQFLITTAPAHHLDGKNVAFGVVREGLSLVKKIEESVGDDGRLTEKILIEDCGVL